MALDSLDKVVKGISSGAILPFYKTGPGTTGAGTLWSVFPYGAWPTPGSIPSSTATYCKDSTNGSLGPITFSASTATGNVYLFQPASASINQWYLYDRLIAIASLPHNATVTLPTSVALTEPANDGRCSSTGSDVEWFIEIYTDIGVTACSVVIQYTCDDDVQYSVAIPIGGASPLNQDGKLIQIPPSQPGKYIKSIIERKQVTSSAVAGNYGFTAMKRLAFVPQMIANVGGYGDWASIGLPQIIGNSCLQLVVLASTTSIGVVTGHIKIAETPT